MKKLNPSVVFAESETTDKAKKPLTSYGATPESTAGVMSAILNLFNELPNSETRQRVFKTVGTFFELEM